MIRFNRESYASEDESRIPTKEEVVAIFKDPDTQLSEAWKVFSLWAQRKEEEMDKANIEYSRLQFNVEAAELLLEAQMLDEAWGYFEGAMFILKNEKDIPVNPDLSKRFAAIRDALDPKDS